MCRFEELFAPTPPAGARTLPRPVSFLGRACWAVDAQRPADDDAGPARSIRYYFDVETGRLTGREGDNISTMAFDRASGTLSNERPIEKP